MRRSERCGIRKNDGETTEFPETKAVSDQPVPHGDGYSLAAVGRDELGEESRIWFTATPKTPRMIALRSMGATVSQTFVSATGRIPSESPCHARAALDIWRNVARVKLPQTR